MKALSCWSPMGEFGYHLSCSFLVYDLHLSKYKCAVLEYANWHSLFVYYLQCDVKSVHFINEFIYFCVFFIHFLYFVHVYLYLCQNHNYGYVPGNNLIPVGGVWMNDSCCTKKAPCTNHVPQTILGSGLLALWYEGTVLMPLGNGDDLSDTSASRLKVVLAYMNMTMPSIITNPTPTPRMNETPHLQVHSKFKLLHCIANPRCDRRPTS